MLNCCKFWSNGFWQLRVAYFYFAINNLVLGIQTRACCKRTISVMDYSTSINQVIFRLIEEIYDINQS